MTEDEAHARALIRLHAWWTRRTYEMYDPPLLRWLAIEVAQGQVVLEGPWPENHRWSRPSVCAFLREWLPV